MKYKKSKWWLTLFISGLVGTIAGAVFNEYFTLNWLGGAVVLSPLSLIIRIAGSLSSLLPNFGISCWTTPFWNTIDVFCVLSLIPLSVFYFRTEKIMWLIIFGITFAILNLGNMNQFTAMMSI